MKVVVCSAMRNAADYLPRYIQQIAGLYLALSRKGYDLYFLFGEGDSTDNTRDMLIGAMKHTKLPCRIFDVSHGGPEFTAVVDPVRFKQAAFVANRVWSNVPPGADIAMWVDTDIIWDPYVLVQLVDRLRLVPGIAPKVMHATDPGLYEGPGPFWYNTFDFRRNGERFSNLPPYHPDLNGQLLKVDSAGSVIALRGKYARLAHWTDEEVVVGMCHQVYEHGGEIYLDPTLEVLHP